MKKVIVIGAGIGGLCAAIELASRGYRVQVLEALPEAGGKAGRVVIDGQEVDTGPSVLTLPEIFDRILKSAGTCLAEHVELLRPSPAFRYIYPDGAIVDIQHDARETLDSVQHTLGSEAREDLERFLAYARKIWDASADTFVFGESPSIGSVLRFGLKGLGQIRSIDAGRTMASAIRARIRSPHLRDLLLRYATYNGSNPETAPATLNCIAHVELVLGGFGVKGGIRALVRALVDVAEQSGVELSYGQPVEALLLDGHRVRGVRANGEDLGADAVVANADPEHVFRHLLPERWGRRLPPPTVPSTSGWNAIAKVPRDPNRAPHTVLFPSGAYAQEFEDLFDRDQPPTDPTVYLCDQERCHARSAWPAHAPLFVMTNAPAEPARGSRPADVWTELEARVRQRLRASGILAEDAEFAWKRTASDLAQIFPGSRGALYGAASNSTFAAFRRPPNRLSKPVGLYLASGGAHPGGGLPLCASSGRVAAEAVHADLGRA